MRFTGNWQERIYAFALMLGIEIVSSYLLTFSPRNELYYFFCGAFNALTISILITRFRYTPLARDLLRLTVIQATIQLLGISLYLLPKVFPIVREIFPVGIYNHEIRFIVTLTFLRIFIVRGGDESGTRTRRRSLFGIRRDTRVPHSKEAK